MTEAETAAARLDRERSRTAVRTHALLLALVVALGLARLWTGPWYHIYNPWGGDILEGWPVSWEVVYYLPHLPTFAGNAPPAVGINPVHERTFVGLFLGATLFRWTGSAFWSIASVELCAWWLAAVATLDIGRRLGLGARASTLAAVLTATSPILISNMWRHDLHTANFATMPLGLWAALVLVDESRTALRLALALGLLLITLSLSYQFQWLMIPMLGVLLVRHRQFARLARLGILLGAIGMFVGGLALVREVLRLVGLGRNDVFGEVVSQPTVLLTAKLEAIHSAGDLAALLPTWRLVVEMIQTYHPLVFAAGVAGLISLPARARWLALVCTVGALFSLSLYPAPWTAMSAYPLLYVGAAAACASAADNATRLAAVVVGPRSPWRDRILAASPAAGAALAVGLAAATNLDLVGNARFVMAFWTYYADPPLF